MSQLDEFNPAPGSNLHRIRESEHAARAQLAEAQAIRAATLAAMNEARNVGESIPWDMDPAHAGDIAAARARLEVLGIQYDKQREILNQREREVERFVAVARHAVSNLYAYEHERFKLAEWIRTHERFVNHTHREELARYERNVQVMIGRVSL
jgi:hypothetical protein